MAKNFNKLRAKMSSERRARNKQAAKRQIGKMKRLRPIDLYNRYPHSDLLVFDAPTKETTWEEFMKDANESGDTLFRFLAHELGDDDCSRAEQEGRLIRAMQDIATVVSDQG
jgi:hypothetical protein